MEFESSDKKYSSENTNVIIDKIPDIIASKTGFTDLAGGNLVVAFDGRSKPPDYYQRLGVLPKLAVLPMFYSWWEASLKYISQ